MVFIYALAYTLPWFLLLWLLLWIIKKKLNYEVSPLKAALFFAVIKYIAVVSMGAENYSRSLSNAEGGITVILVLGAIGSIIFQLADKFSKRN